MANRPLRVGGVEPFSTVDFPGHLAAVVFCQGCPLACGYCHNPDLIPATADRMLDFETVLDALAARQRKARGPSPPRGDDRGCGVGASAQID